MFGLNRSHLPCQRNWPKFSTQMRLNKPILARGECAEWRAWSTYKIPRICSNPAQAVKIYARLGSKCPAFRQRSNATGQISAIVVNLTQVRVRLTNVNAHEIETRIGGGGSVEIEGTVAIHKASVSGGATLSAKNWQHRSLKYRLTVGETRLSTLPRN